MPVKPPKPPTNEDGDNDDPDRSEAHGDDRGVIDPNDIARQSLAARRFEGLWK
jgi:hypothetical protein